MTKKTEDEARCPLCKRDGVEVLSGGCLAVHRLPIWYSLIGKRCPMSGAFIELRA